MQINTTHKMTTIAASLMLAVSAYAGENAMLVLDASGSMWGQIDGKTKIEIARAAVKQLTSDWPAANSIGLVAYGHRSKGDCNDIETLLPLGPLDAATFNQKVTALNPKGMTPISAAVRHAATALKFTEQKATVILISDGEETCNADPCAVAKELESLGVDFTAHVIGFDVSNDKGQAQLQCLAKNTGGRYLPARNAAELSDALDTVARDEPALPPADASIEAPTTAAATSVIKVRWTGPADRNDWIGFATVGSPAPNYLSESATWYDIKPGQFDIELHAPSVAGSYELRYVSPDRDQPMLAMQKIEVTPLTAILKAPATAMAFDAIQIEANGPTGDRHWVGFALPGGDKSNYVGNSWSRVDASGKTKEAVTAPGDPGKYEIRYVLNEGEEVLFSVPITVTAAVGKLLNPPASAPAGQPLSINFEGPRNPGGDSWIGIITRGGTQDDYQAYCQLPASGPCVFTPREAGSYDLVYVVGGSIFLDRQPIEVQ